jgi:translation initiation factor RLI1
MPPKKKDTSDEEDKLTRIAIVNKDKCKPKKCRQVRHLFLTCVVEGARAEELIAIDPLPRPPGMQEALPRGQTRQDVH